MAYPDRPDLKTQIALNKVLGITPTLTPAEQKLYVEQQWLESEQKRMAQEKGLPSVLGGDVRSYTGSMFAPAGSPMAAVPIPQGAPRVGEAGGGIDVNAYRGSMFGEGVMGAAPVLGSRNQPYNPNVSADVILGQRFGQRPVGQISVAPTTPQTYTQGQQTPSGAVLGQGESIAMGGQARPGYTIGGPQYGVQPTGQTPTALTQNDEYFSRNLRGAPFQQVYGTMASAAPTMGPAKALGSFTGTLQQDILNQTQPVQPSILGGSPIPMQQQAPVMAPLLGAYQPGSSAYNYYQQQGVAPQTGGYAAQAAAGSPQQRQLALQQQQLGFEQQDRAVKRLSADLAAGRINESSIPPELLGQVRMNASEMGLKNRVTQAQLAQLEAKPLPSESYASFAEANDAIKKQMGNFPANTVPTIKLQGNRYVVETSVASPSSMLTPEQQLQVESGKQAIASGSKYVEGIKQNYADSSAQFESASAIKNAINSPKITTGFLAKSSGVFKNVAESVFGADLGAAEQAIYTKGVSGFGLAGVRSLFRGLGAMSDADRARGESTVMSITDPKQSIKYYIEVAKLNQDRARDDVNFVNKLQRSGVNADEIQRQVEERKMTRPPISEQAYQSVFGKTTAPQNTSTLTPTGQPTSFTSGKYKVTVRP